MIKVNIMKDKGYKIGEKVITGKTSGYAYVEFNGKRKLVKNLEVK